MLLFSITVMAQQYEEVVYLKNGSRIKGTVIEMTAEQIKVKIYDGSIIAYQSTEIEKIAKENPITTNKNSFIQRHPKEWSTKGYRTYGYSGFLDAGYAMRTSDTGFEYAFISTSHGYQFNPYLFGGLGVSAQFVTGACYGEDLGKGIELLQDFDGSDIGVVVFANARGYLLNNKISPYLDFRIGYATTTKGMYLQPTIGIAIGKFDFGIGLGCQPIKYLYMEGKVNDWDKYEKKETELNVNFKIGVIF